jgi:hypothetical protein
MTPHDAVQSRMVHAHLDVPGARPHAVRGTHPYQYQIQQRRRSIGEDGNGSEPYPDDGADSAAGSHQYEGVAEPHDESVASEEAKPAKNKRSFFSKILRLGSGKKKREATQQQQDYEDDEAAAEAEAAALEAEEQEAAAKELEAAAKYQEQREAMIARMQAGMRADRQQSGAGLARTVTPTKDRQAAAAAAAWDVHERLRQQASVGSTRR